MKVPKMLANIDYHGQRYQINLNRPIDISIPLQDKGQQVKAWYAPEFAIEPVVADGFIGDIAQGGSINFKNLIINPHGNGTHTECVAHISDLDWSINDCLKRFFFLAKLVSIRPEKQTNGDKLVTAQQLMSCIGKGEAEALVLRTKPNDPRKQQRDYSGKNPAYLDHKGVLHLVKCGIEHLLLDLPSVDREEDGAKFLAHKAFWNYPKNTRMQATITEMIYVPSEVKDGLYFVDLNIISLVSDASPSKPVLYKIEAQEGQIKIKG